MKLVILYSVIGVIVIAFGILIIGLLEGGPIDCHRCHAKNRRKAKRCENCGTNFPPESVAPEVTMRETAGGVEIICPHCRKRIGAYATRRAAYLNTGTLLNHVRSCH